MFGAFEFFNIVAKELIVTFLGELDRAVRILLVCLFTFVLPAVLSAFFLPIQLSGLVSVICLLLTVMVLESVEKDLEASSKGVDRQK